MKILIICYSHGSLALIDLCARLAERYSDIEPVAICDSRFANSFRDKLNERGCVWELWDREGEATELPETHTGILRRIKEAAAVLSNNRIMTSVIEFLRTSSSGLYLTQKHIE